MAGAAERLARATARCLRAGRKSGQTRQTAVAHRGASTASNGDDGFARRTPPHLYQLLLCVPGTLGAAAARLAATKRKRKPSPQVDITLVAATSRRGAHDERRARRDQPMN